MKLLLLLTSSVETGNTTRKFLFLSNFDEASSILTSTLTSQGKGSSYSADPRYSLLLWDPKFHRRVHEIPPWDLILN